MKFEFLISTKIFTKYCMGHTYTKSFFTVHLKFKFNWASCILSDNSSWNSFSITSYKQATIPRPVNTTSKKRLKSTHFSPFLLPPPCSKYQSKNLPTSLSALTLVEISLTLNAVAST